MFDVILSLRLKLRLRLNLKCEREGFISVRIEISSFDKLDISVLVCLRERESWQLFTRYVHTILWHLIPNLFNPVLRFS